MLQFEIDGRPDGDRPNGFETYLSFYKNKLKRHRDRYSKKRFYMTDDDCFNLRQEAIQFYYRYISFFQFKDFEGVINDTQHNPNILSFIEKYTTEDEITWGFLQYFPYITMMQTRAKVSIETDDKNITSAIEQVEQGIECIKNFFISHEKREVLNNCVEIEFLGQWKKHLIEGTIKSNKEELELNLNKAVLAEDYEKAAQIRDKIQSLENR